MSESFVPLWGSSENPYDKLCCSTVSVSVNCCWRGWGEVIWTQKFRSANPASVSKTRLMSNRPTVAAVRQRKFQNICLGTSSTSLSLNSGKWSFIHVIYLLTIRFFWAVTSSVTATVSSQCSLSLLYFRSVESQINVLKRWHSGCVRAITRGNNTHTALEGKHVRWHWWFWRLYCHYYNCPKLTSAQISYKIWDMHQDKVLSHHHSDLGLFPR